MRIEKRRMVMLACALAVTCSVPGCISYATHVAKEGTYRQLAIATGLAALEVGAGLLGGYAASKDESSDEHSFPGPMLGVMGGIFVVDAIVALGLYISED